MAELATHSFSPCQSGSHSELADKKKSGYTGNCLFI